MGLAVPLLGRWSPGVATVAVTGIVRGLGSHRRVKEKWSYLPVVVDGSGNQFLLATSPSSQEEANGVGQEMAEAFGVGFVRGQHRCQLVSRRFLGLGGPCEPYQRDYMFHPVNILIYIFCFLMMLRLFLLMACGIRYP
jgi:hypothetical protein